MEKTGSQIQDPFLFFFKSLQTNQNHQISEEHQPRQMLEEDQSQKLSKKQLLKQYMHPQVNPLLTYINSPNPNIFLFLHMQNVLLNKKNSRGNRYHDYTKINYQFQV